MPVQHATYSIDREILTWFGLDLHEGLAEGDSSIKDALDSGAGWTQKPNGVGGVVQQYNPKTSGKLTLKISREHSLHTTLKALHTADRLTRALAGPLIWQRSSGETIIYDVARIERDPDEAGGTTTGDAEWVWIFGARFANAGDIIANII
jgi:hypothetical protein